MNNGIIYGVAAAVCAALLAFSATPAVRVLAYKIGAIDKPVDGRRMHKRPIPRIGGLAMFIAFLVTSLAFSKPTNALVSVWIGGFILVVLGIIDDVVRLGPWIKLLVQTAVAFIAVSQGITVDFIRLGGIYIPFGIWNIPLTVLWIVGLTNAMNFIDGLDGLACGISAIGSVSLTLIMIITGRNELAVLTAILAGSCVGFLPFNTNPAKIIMGDTGALFLGYTLSVLSIEGLFKVHAVMSFIIPFSIFGLPLFDTALAIIRRLLHGKSPFSADRGHLHHKLVDMGFGHKQTVRILYAISGVLGIAAVMLTDESLFSPGIIIAAAFVIYIIDFILIKNAKNRALTGLTNIDAPEEIDSAEESIFLNEKDAQNQNGKNGNENLKEKTSESSSGE